MIGDILVWGTTLEEHDTRLRKVQSQTTKKCKFHNKEDMGHNPSEQGRKPGYKKVQAVESMRELKNKNYIEAFLIFIQYLLYIYKFLPNMPEESTPQL